MFRAIIVCFLLLLPAWTLGSYIIEFLRVDSALDAGASYDYSRRVADFEHSQPYVSFWKQHFTQIIISVFSLLGALILLFHTRIKTSMPKNH